MTKFLQTARAWGRQTLKEAKQILALVTLVGIAAIGEAAIKAIGQ